MRILMVTPSFLPELGGMEIHIAKLGKALSELGHQLTIVSADFGPSFMEGFRVYRFPQLLDSKKTIRMIWTLGFITPYFLPKIIYLILQHDITHGHCSSFHAALFGILSRLLKRPFIVTLHGYGTLDSSIQKNPWRSFWRKISLKLSNKIIATSNEMAEIASRFVDANRVVVIPNGVDTSEFVPKEDPPHAPIRIATVRRLVPKNGVQYLVEAAPIILSLSKIPIEFWIVGDGELMDYLKRRTKELGVDSTFTFWGAMTNDKVKDILSQTHLVVFPSSAETTSLAALEAMSMGKCVVASAVGGYPELIGNNERGVLVNLFESKDSNYMAPLTLPPERISLLAETIVQLIHNPQQMKELGQKAMTFVKQKYDWKIIAKKVEEIYRMLVKN